MEKNGGRAPSAPSWAARWRRRAPSGSCSTTGARTVCSRWRMSCRRRDRPRGGCGGDAREVVRPTARAPPCSKRRRLAPPRATCVANVVGAPRSIFAHGNPPPRNP